MIKTFHVFQVFISFLSIVFLYMALHGRAAYGENKNVETLSKAQSIADSAGEVLKMIKINKSDSEWKKQLNAEEYQVTRCSATEAPFTGKYWNNHEKGIYKCVCCGLELFSSDTKFNSGTGWPSFYAPIKPDNVATNADKSHGMVRNEIICPRCGAHLGHVFPDGPQPTGLRYCVNSTSLKFTADDKKVIEPAKKIETAAFAAGCFWGVEDAFSRVKGVVSTKVGYMGGHFQNPTYEYVCTDMTGHAETVQLEYDPSTITYDHLLSIFWQIHDPTTINRQGPDVGSQYRSVIFYYSPEQKEKALASKQKQATSGLFKKKIVTEIVSAPTFWPAEEYHQKYFQKHGGHACRIPSFEMKE
jgi:peptide methionine sulfoxide reductase msrA/msrB